MICRLHADRDIRDGVVDLFLCAGEGLIRVDDGAVALVRGKVAVAVMGDEAPQPLAEIKESILGPQVHHAVAAGGPCQSDNAPDAGTHLQQGAEAFCLITLEAGQLVDDHHVVVKGQVRDLVINYELLNHHLHDINLVRSMGFPHELGDQLSCSGFEGGCWHLDSGREPVGLLFHFLRSLTSHLSFCTTDDLAAYAGSGCVV